jgi:ribokinase
MAEQPRVIVLGSINTDLVIRVPHLPRRGETVIGGSFFSSLGGKGANQAVAAARAGRGFVAFVSAVGDDDFGRRALAALGQEQLQLDHVEIYQQHSTGVAMIQVDEQGANCIAVDSGANSAVSINQIDRIAAEVFADAKVFLASLEVPLATVQRGLERAKAAGLTTILNPAPVSDPAAIAGLMPLVDVLTPNEVEAAALAGMSISDVNSAQQAAVRMLAAGWRNVIITLGEQGIMIASAEGTRHLPALVVQAVDTTAAGDAFNGALAVARAEGHDMDAAAHFASAAAAISVTSAGAIGSLPTRFHIERFLGDR